MTKIERVIKILKKQRNICHENAKYYKAYGDNARYDAYMSEAWSLSNAIMLLTDDNYLKGLEMLFEEDK